MITLVQLTEMLEMQEALLIRIDGNDWRSKQRDYKLCVFMECAEIIEYTNWKHWKANDVDKPNYDAIAMEVIDIWHFGMAHFLMFDIPTHALYDSICDTEQDVTQENVDIGIANLCVGLIMGMYNSGVFPLGNFVALMRCINMDWDNLYRLYIGKNILNWFRQDHGYKEGLYIKTWGDAEDNEHLFEITQTLGEDFDSAELVKCLSARYALAGH